MEIYPEKSVARKAILASWLGWLMDGYVSIAYIVQAGLIISIFFPTGILSILYYLFFVFSGAFRVFGSAVLGNYIGDKLGRRRMMVLTVGVFSISGAAIGALPTYGEAGVLAPALLGILLIIMGIFAGAEYGGGTALSMENVPPAKRNFLGAVVQSGFGTGFAILSLVYFILTRDLSAAQYASYGWRILFLTTGLVGLITLFVRRITRETKVFEEIEKKGEIESIPVFKFLTEQWRGIIVMLMVTGALLFINTATFSLYAIILQEVNGFTSSSSAISLLVINAISVIGVIAGGFIASRSRRKMPYMLAYGIIFLVSTVAVSSAAFSGNYAVVTVSFTVQAFFEAMIFSTLPSFLSEVFSKRFRTTGVGFVYNLGSTIGVTAFLIIPHFAGISSWGFVWPLSLILTTVVLIAGIIISWLTLEKGMQDRDMITE